MSRPAAVPSRTRRRAGAAWPSAQQELLLRAALSDGPGAVEAWSAWKRAGDIETADAASQRIFPLLYRNLADAGVDAAELTKLKGVYRYSWYRNQLLFASGGALLRDLAAAGLDTMILKGAALATIHYEDIGARPMIDFDVLVPRERAVDAMEILKAAGWRPAFPRPETRLAVWHAVPFLDGNGRRVDLHWNVLWQVGADEDFWGGARETTLGGVPTKALGDADQVMHVCAHGLRWEPIQTIRWVADAIKVLTAPGATIDWDRLVRSARINHLTLALEHSLEYLRERYDAPVPAEVVAALARSPRSRFERFVFGSAMRGPTPVQTLVMLWDRQRRVAATLQPGDSTAGYTTYLQEHWGLERRGQIPGHVIRRLNPAVRRPRR